MKTTRLGYTLIELMIVVAIIAILAAIALPALFGERGNDDPTIIRGETSIQGADWQPPADNSIKRQCVDGFVVVATSNAVAQLKDEQGQPVRCTQ